MLAMMLATLLATLLGVTAGASDVRGAYDPVADPTAVVLCSSTLRLSILTEKIVRAESLPAAGLQFEDRATISFVNRRLPVPSFTVKNTSDWCNVSIKNGYDVALRKLDAPQPPPGPTPPPPPPKGTCENVHQSHDAKCDGPCERVAPVVTSTQNKCCAACDVNAQCGTWVFDTDKSLCYLLAHGTVTGIRAASNRTLGGETGGHGPGPGPKHGLRAPGVLQTAGDGWTWNAWDDEDPETNPTSPNLLGTLLGTPSADLAGCCDNPNASAGEYDPKTQYALQPGLLSRAGCTAVDDSDTPLYDIVDGNLDDAWLSNTTAFPAVEGRDDLYIFGCGNDYRGCLADFVRVAGPMALPPLASLGVWWSRHWGNPHNIPWGKEYFGAMTEENIMNEVVTGYTQRNLPMHVLVMDMEWHNMFTEPCYTGGPGNWGGYTWNKTLFPDPHAFVSKLNGMRGPLGIKVAVNTHPDVGINACQENYAAMAAAIGFETEGNKTMTDLNQACGTEAKDKSMTCSREYVEAYFKYMINPTAVSGASVAADYSWTDSPDVTTFTNELYVRYPGTKRKKRSINFSRYGGLGQHRTPVGFSGDTKRQWDTLTYQTYFTPRAANVGFGWWSHDIGGFSGSPVDSVFHTEGPELYLRWLQFGCYAPIFRTHCRYCEQRPWTFGDDWYALMRRPMVTRSNLVPYIYSHAALRAYESGEALLTPTYWDPAAANEAEAYAPEFGRQYFFGRDFLVAPVTEPLSHDPEAPPNNDTTWDASNTGVVSRSVWLPPGEWVAWTSARRSRGIDAGADADPAEILQGPVVDTRHYGLNETPVYIRAGSVIPTRTMASAYHTTSDPLVWMMAPSSGEAKGEGVVYEDDGESLDFRSFSQPELRPKVAATTTLSYATELQQLDAAEEKKTLEVLVSAPNGTFHGRANSRAQWFVLYGEAKPPSSASCDGKLLSKTSTGVAPGWWITERNNPNMTPTDEGGNELMVEAPSLVLACASAPTASPRELKIAW